MPDHIVHLGNGQTRRFPSDATPQEIEEILNAEDQPPNAETPTPAGLLASRLKLNQSNATPLSEPSTYWGGVGKGIKDYGKDIVSDPTTMAGVGATAGLAATLPVSWPVALGTAAAAGIGAAGGAGAAHIVKQLRSGPEDASDVLGSMGKHGAIDAALTTVPPLARKGGNALMRRAASLESLQGWTGLARRYLPGTITGSIVGPIFGKEAGAVAGGVVEAAQSPMVNRTAGRVLQGVGDIPDAMSSLMGRVRGEAGTFAEDAAARRSAGLRGDIPRTRWNPKTTIQTAREEAESAARTVPNDGPRVDVSGAKDWPVDEPIYSDVRSQLDDVAGLDDELALTREMIAKGFKPDTARRIVSPAMRSLSTPR